MRGFLIFLLILGGFSSCQRKQQVAAPRAVTVHPGAPLELNLMSFNVRYENAEDVGDRSWSRRIVESVHLIRRESPDIFGVQEAMHGQVADLWASLPEYGFFGVGRDDGKWAGEYAGIFYRKDRFEADLTDSGVQWLSDTPDVAGSRTWGSSFARIVTWIRLIDRSTGRGLYAFNTHFDHKNQYARERSALFIAAKMDARKHPNEPFFLMGDLNAVESNPAVSYLTGKSVTVAGKTTRWEGGALLDTFQSLHAGQKDRRTLHFWSRNQSGTLKVDHILVFPGAQILKSAIVTKWPGMVSDHFPVTAKVVFP